MAPKRDPILIAEMMPNTTNPLVESIRRSLEAESESGSMDAPFESTLHLRLSRQPANDKKAELTYPYAHLPSNVHTYRGYPTRGADELKKAKKWKVQIVNPACGAPPYPLPQFPQQEVLVRSKAGDYQGSAPLSLNEKETNNNSGEAWLMGEEKPRSEFFFTAGYKEGSAVRLQKPYTESIYRSVISGTPVPVKVVKTSMS